MIGARGGDDGAVGEEMMGREEEMMGAGRGGEMIGAGGGDDGAVGEEMMGAGGEEMMGREEEMMGAGGGRDDRGGRRR